MKKYVWIQNPTTYTVSNTLTTCGNNDGAIAITVTGAAGVPTYSWTEDLTVRLQQVQQQIIWKQAFIQ